MLCDASILVALIVPEPTSIAVLEMIGKSDLPVMSDFAFGEVCSAMSIRVRKHQISSNEAERILALLEDWADRNARHVAIEPTDVAQATRFVRRFDLGLRMPDALHLALARRIDTPIATQDRRQAAAAAALGLRFVTPLPF